MMDSPNSHLDPADLQIDGEIDYFEVSRHASQLRAAALASGALALRRFVTGLFRKERPTADTAA